MNNYSICDLEERKKYEPLLPEDVYKENILVELDCSEFFTNLYKNKQSQKLEYKHLIKVTERVLKNIQAVAYLRKKSSLFDMMYEHHYIKNNKCFIEMEKIDSFIFSMLTYLYN